MKIIGITGGIGAGKSKVLEYMEENYKCILIRADEVAHLVKMPGEPCYQKLVQLLGSQILNDKGNIDNSKMASVIFDNKYLLNEVNAIIHPFVKVHIQNRISEERKKDMVDYFFVEAALLIEDHYDEMVDEMWYIYASLETRVKRLMESREYSIEKINSIMEKQLKEQDFRNHCKVVINNNNDFSSTKKQIDIELGGVHDR